jgi:hypothetical protein
MEIAFLFPEHPEKITDFLPSPERTFAAEMSGKSVYAVEFSDH